MAGEYRSWLTSQVRCQVTVRYTRCPWRPRWSRESNAHPRIYKIKQIHIIRTGCYSVSTQAAAGLVHRQCRRGSCRVECSHQQAGLGARAQTLVWTCEFALTIPTQGHPQTGRQHASIPGKSSAPHEPMMGRGHPWTCSSVATHRLMDVLLSLCLQLWGNTLHFVIYFNEMSLTTKCSSSA